MFHNQIEKIVNESVVSITLICLEDFLDKKDVINLGSSDVAYFVCSNFNKIKKAMTLINGGHIINKNCVIIDKSKYETQLILQNYNILTPFIFSKNLKFPLIMKEKKHQGITIKVYNLHSYNNLIKSLNIQDFYLEEALNESYEIKVYYINGQVFYKNNNVMKKDIKEIEKICNEIAYNIRIDVYSADLVKDNNLFKVIDLNMSPGFYQNDDARECLIDYMEKL